MAELRLGFADKDRTVVAKVGDCILIVLPENATTGFQWRVASFTEGTLALESTERTAAHEGPPGAGGGEVIARFRAMAIGPGNVVLKLSRGIEEDASVFKFDLNLKIGGTP